MRSKPRLHSRILFFMGAFIVFGTLSAFLARALFAPGDLATRPSNVDVFESGPQVGSKVPGAFHPFNINGKAAGDEECLFCRYGDAPVAMVFASKLSPQVPALVRGLEKAATAAAGEVGACLIVTENNAETKSALTKLADAENLKRVVLAMIESRDLKKYALHAEAEVTVLLYSKQVVRINHAFKAGELTEKHAEELGDEAAKFLSGK